MTLADLKDALPKKLQKEEWGGTEGYRCKLLSQKGTYPEKSLLLEDGQSHQWHNALRWNFNPLTFTQKSIFQRFFFVVSFGSGGSHCGERWVQQDTKEMG